MRSFKTLLAGGIAAALAVGMVAAPASAGSKTAVSDDGATSVRVVAKDVKTVKGTFKVKDWLTIAVNVPDAYTATDGSVVRSEWSLSITGSGGSNTTCPGWNRFPTAIGTYAYGDGKVILPMTGTGYRRNTGGYPDYYYWGSGTCKLDVSLRVYRKGDYDKGISTYSTTVNLATSYHNLTKSTASLRSASTVKKNRTFTVSGTAKFQRPQSKYAYRNMKRGSKVAIQFKKSGSSTWKTIRTAKVASNGKYSAKVKIGAKGKLRAVVLPSSSVAKGYSASRSIKVKR